MLGLSRHGLADLGAEGQEAEQQDVSHGEAVAAHIGAALHQAVEPEDLVPGDGLQVLRRLGAHQPEAGLKQRPALGGAEAARLRPGEELLGRIKLGKEKIENGFRKEIEDARARIGQRARDFEARRNAKSKSLPKPALALLRKLGDTKIDRS